MYVNPIYTLPFTLKRTTLVEIVVLLSRHPKAIAANAYDMTWTMFKNNARGIIRGWRFTKQLRTDLTVHVLYVGCHMQVAHVFFKKVTISVDHEVILQRIQVSPLGTVDYQKTARTLLDDRVVPRMIAYRLARLFYLEDRIEETYNNMMPEDRDMLGTYLPHAIGRPTTRLYEIYSNQKGEWSEFVRSVVDRNLVAVRHLWKAMAPTMEPEDKVSLIRDCLVMLRESHMGYSKTFPLECVPGIYLFLLSRLTSEEVKTALLHRQQLRYSLGGWPYKDCMEEHYRV